MASDAQTLAIAKIRTAIRDLLENDPPFKRIEYALAEMETLNRLCGLCPDAISLPCSACGGRVTTWRRRHDGSFPTMDIKNPGEVHPLYTYKCWDCTNRETMFWVAFRSTTRLTTLKTDSSGTSLQTESSTAGTIEKVAQWPRWTIRSPKRIEKVLGDKAELFRRGLHCLQDGYGIGAAAYLRRVVEDEAKAIVELVREAAVLDGDDEAVKNADEALKANLAADRLRIAKERIPPTMRVDGGNPLEVLYGNLSGPLHSESDEKGVAVASMLLEALWFLFESLKERVEEKKRYAKTIRAARERLAQVKKGSEGG
jgi:hypothetical protein